LQQETRKRPQILVIAGPTASGKTAVAATLARRYNGELVGGDSVQVYRGFDIGSAKPTAAELGAIPHHLIDVIEPTESIDAAGFATLADQAIADISERGHLPIVVGGTGLWLRALLRGLVELPLPDLTIRSRLEAEARALGPPTLHARLTEVDPLYAAAIHPNDELRIVRALEVYEQTGQPLGELHRAHQKGSPRYPFSFIALDRPREELYTRIDARIDAMLEAGWLDETRQLIARYGSNIRALRSVGYRELVAHLEHHVPFEETVRRIRKSTRIYTRRQRTWLASEPSVTHRTSPDTLLSESGEQLLTAFRENSTAHTAF
jgi:tRNA dimethylallyltransferase